MTASPMFIIEDDDHFRETFIDVMSLKGVEVAGVRTGAEARKALSQARPAVIIMDVQLPDVHGFDLCREVKSLAGCADTPVILVSAATQYNDPRDWAEGLSAGASRFLSKPVTVEKLWAEIEALLKRRPSA